MHSCVSFLKDIKLVKNTYNCSTSITQSGSAGNGSQVYRLNSVYDPSYSNGDKNVTAGGYAMLATIYQKYIVFGCKVVVKVTNTASYPMAVALSVQTNTTLSTSVMQSAIGNRAGAKQLILGPAGSSKCFGTLKGYWNVADVYGMRKSEYNTQANQVAVGSNPTNAPAYLFISCGTLPEISLTGGTIICEVYLTYYTQWSDLYDNIVDS